MRDQIQTSRWIRNRSDENAVAAGYSFDALAGGYVVWWIERYCKLYEGDHSGEPMILRGCHEDPLDLWEIHDEWDEDAQEAALERAEHYCECVEVGKACDWQYEAIMRLFSWVRWEDRHQRQIRRFRRGGVFVPKKSKKSPQLAAIALFLTCGDGEPGNKVFFGAKDGSQAREIAGKHAVEMVHSSPELNAECSINKNLMQVTHEGSRSVLKPMSSGDSRTQQSKEGINGSVLIDETHVVDADFIARVCRAGISRAEPFHLEFSTAGRDPDCYGKQVERGDVEDNGYFFLCYEAPQTLSDEELFADPLKYGRMANPAWGHTIHEDEFLADLNRSKQSVSDLADFKTYRLNIWQRSRSPWIRWSDWGKCASEEIANETALLGRDCWAGLDKSKTRDMTAIVLTFHGDEEDEYIQLPYFWLPQATAEANSHLAAFLDWAKAGDLNLIPGEVIYDAPLLAFIEDLNNKFRIQAIYYDRTFAADITLALETDFGIPRVEFPQTTMMFAGPIEDYERAVIQGKLRHPDHPVMNWQAGHCETYTDSKGRKTLVKPKHGDIKKIDGMVAGVMSLFGAIQAPKAEFWSPTDGITL